MLNGDSSLERASSKKSRRDSRETGRGNTRPSLLEVVKMALIKRRGDFVVIAFTADELLLLNESIRDAACQYDKYVESMAPGDRKYAAAADLRRICSFFAAIDDFYGQDSDD